MTYGALQKTNGALARHAASTVEATKAEVTFIQIAKIPRYKAAVLVLSQ